MTASHIQVLRAGLVQPIGLPPTNTMGVTNARALHRRLLNNNNEAISNNNSLNVLGARRCLFGSPEPGEIQSLYIEEMKKNREHFLQRYRFDILADRFVAETAVSHKSNATDSQIENHNNTESSRENTESRLHEDQSGTDSTLCLNTSSYKSICDKECNLDDIKLLTITKNTSKTSVNSAKVIQSSIVDSTSSQILKDRKFERIKPYSRQNCITEYYAARKALTPVTHTIDIAPLAKPQKAEVHTQQQEKLQRCKDV